MKKRGIVITVLLFSLVTALALYADKTHGESERSVDEIITQIRTEQKLKAGEKINPEKVDNQLLEELGSSLMDIMHPDAEEHEWMDRMMGGEGSGSLQSMHRAMGYNYLSGHTRYMFGPGMMGAIPARKWYGGRYMGHMMNSWGMPWGGMSYGFGGIFMWILLIIVAAFAMYFFIKASKGNLSSGTGHEAPLDILKKRYAKGEISKDEFEKIKKDLL